MRKPVLFCLITIFASCGVKNEEQATTQTYFSISDYFKTEAERLSKTNPNIVKTVFVNGKTEEKKLRIANWEQELSSFIDADINKASWKGSFQLTKTDTSETYLSQSEKIPVKKVEISLKDKKVEAIKIFLQNKNVLYSSTDSLVYLPNSFFEINKTQKIKLMDTKRYIIKGKFN